LAKTEFLKNRNKGQSPVRLAERRRKLLILRVELIFGLFVVLVGALSYFSYYPTFTLSNIEVVGLDGVEKQALESFVDGQLQGGYLHVFSKRNYLLYPKTKLHEQILSQFKKTLSVTLSVGVRPIRCLRFRRRHQRVYFQVIALTWIRTALRLKSRMVALYRW
jgi:hypothetical protein